MAGNSFGQVFRITTAGESHGPANVVIVDGCPPGLELSTADLAGDLARRRPGQSRIVTQRQETDDAEILSGVFEGRTTGTPIAILIRNVDQKSRDYSDIKDRYRPGHADYSYDAKYGFRDYRGGGRASARETVARVAAGAIAKKVISTAFGGQVVGYVKQVGDIVADVPEPENVTLDAVESLSDGAPNIVRCPDHEAASRMVELVERVRKEQDSIGGVAEIVATGVPAGLGEPVFDKLKADLAKALFSIPAVLGVEYGVGFGCADTARQREQRRVHDRRRRTPHRHAHQSPRRNARRHQLGHADRTARRGQAHQQPAAGAGDGDATGRAQQHPHARSPRPVPLAALRADRRGDGGAGARRSLSALDSPDESARRRIALTTGMRATPRRSPARAARPPYPLKMNRSALGSVAMNSASCAFDGGASSGLSGQARNAPS